MVLILMKSIFKLIMTNFSLSKSMGMQLTRFPLNDKVFLNTDDQLSTDILHSHDSRSAQNKSCTCLPHDI